MENRGTVWKCDVLDTFFVAVTLFLDTHCMFFPSYLQSQLSLFQEPLVATVCIIAHGF